MLFELPDVSASPTQAASAATVGAMTSAGATQALGAIYTRAEVVEFILDLVGYDVSEPLHRRRILEPSFGRGDFLLPIVERLLAAWRNHGGRASLAAEELLAAIRGVELQREVFAATRETVLVRLQQEGIPASVASELVNRWLVQGDFLLEKQPSDYDFVVGNPPYVRQELIPPALLTEYRRRYRTMYDRADLYIPFIERSLSLLAEDGVLSFICADRWMKNRYGGPLREFIARGFHLQSYIDMVGADAFHTEVSAYP
ncbi:MAG: N-6 DNA methylase, partial [Lentisphaerae bacterium]|nr:N-6 DNA methylase [Lentisphaerota bacterium]